MQSILSLAAFGLLVEFFLVSGLETSSNVIELTSDNFDEKMEEGAWLLKIYVPW